MNVIDILTSGGVAVVASDTIYGVVGQALKPATVERIYQIKRRNPTKPFIILIHDIDEVAQFGVQLDEELRQQLSTYWPGKVSIILPCDPAFEYLHRGTGELAFRLPAKLELQAILEKTGPLVAPSANPEGLEPATTIDEARAYFGDEVDEYVSGTVSDKPSTIIRIVDGTIETIRA